VINKDVKQDPLENLADALTEDIFNTPDDELLREVEEDYGDPHALANKFDQILERAEREVAGTARGARFADLPHNDPGIVASILDGFARKLLEWWTLLGPHGRPAWVVSALAVVFLAPALVLAGIQYFRQEHHFTEPQSGQALTEWAGSANAAKFSNSYLSFLLPRGWTCKQEEGTEFVCDPPRAEGEPVHSIMILTAKEAGASDTLSEYRQHLEQRAKMIGPNAVVVAPHLVDISGVIWADATLNASEVPNYNTRYLATVKDGIAVLFTFSAHHSTFEQSVRAAVQAVYTLRLRDEWRDRPRNVN